MKHKNTKINIGGMFRCCIESINKYYGEIDVNDGDRIICTNCRAEFSLRNGEWFYVSQLNEE